MAVRDAFRSARHGLAGVSKLIGGAGRNRGATKLRRAVSQSLEQLEDRRYFYVLSDLMTAIPFVTEYTGYTITAGAESDASPDAQKPSATPEICPPGATQSDPKEEEGNRSAPSSSSGKPIRYIDGKPIVAATDLESGGFGTFFGVTRTWAGVNNVGPFGNGWASGATAYLSLQSASAGGTSSTDVVLSLNLSGDQGRQFQVPKSSSSFGPITARFFTQDQLSYSDTNDEFTFVDASGNAMVFYDLPRSSGNISLGSTSYNNEGTYGKLKKVIDVAGNETTYTYDGNGNLDYIQRNNLGNTARERFDFTFTQIYNSVTDNDGTATANDPWVATNVTLKRWDGSAYVDVRKVDYSYYTGELTLGGTADPHGRLGDLKLVQVKDASNNVIDSTYYRYYKFTGVGAAASRGPGNNLADALGPTALDFESGDNLIWSGIKSVVSGANFSRMAASYSSYESLPDVDTLTSGGGSDANGDGDAENDHLRTYANKFLGYERWGDAAWEAGFASAYWDNADGDTWNDHYKTGTQYRVIDESVTGAGCTTCSDGIGYGKFEYAVSASQTGLGNYTLVTQSGQSQYVFDANIWRHRTVEYLPDTTKDTWTDNDRNIVYTNEKGQVIYSVLADVNAIDATVTGTTTASNGGGYDITLSTSGHGLVAGDYVALSGFDDAAFNSVCQVYAVSGSTISVWMGNAAISDATPGYANAGIAKVSSYEANQYKYDTSGRMIQHSTPSAFTSLADDYFDDLSFNSDVAAVLSSSQGLVKRYLYADVTDSGLGDGSSGSQTSGRVSGYLAAVIDQRGTSSTRRLVEHYEYFTRTGANGATVHPTAFARIYTADTTTLNDSSALTTSYTYTWASGKAQIERLKVTTPTVTTGQNGSNSADFTEAAFDVYGRPVWMKDEAGSLMYLAYDEGTGAVTKRIVDVDTDNTGDFAGLPSGWSNSAGLHLKTTTEVDGLGRATKLTDPNGNVTYTVFKDSQHEVRIYAGWNTSTNDVTGLISVVREYRPAAGEATLGKRPVFTEVITSSATPSLNGSNLPTGTETISTSNIESLSRSITNDAGQAVKQNGYFSLSGATYDASTAEFGTASNDSSTGNYHSSETQYDGRGWLKRTKTPAGTITRFVRDARGLVTSVWVGTDDAPTSGFWSPTNTAGTDLVKVSQATYDSLGNPTDERAYPGYVVNSGGDGVSVAPPRVTLSYYDWRGRLVAVKNGIELDGSGNPIAVTTENQDLQRQAVAYTLDNLGRVTATDVYDGDRVAFSILTSGSSSVLGTLLVDSNNDGTGDVLARRGRTESAFDARGRVYQSKIVEVVQSTGSTSGTNAATTNHWYDPRGNLIKTDAPGGLITKRVYDGANRVTTVYQLDDNSTDSVYGDADDVTGDVVLDQYEYTYDANGNVIASLVRQRFHDATDTGALGNPSSSSGTAKARVSYAVSYYDALDRLTASVDVGTNGGSSYTRPGSVPSRSDTALVTSYAYDLANQRVTTTDPRGIDARTETDLLGRTVKTIAAYVDGTPSASDDQTTLYTYTGNGDVLTLKASLPSSAYQETKYIYSEATQTASTVTYDDPNDRVTFNLTAHGYKVGEMVTIAGSSATAFNGTFRVATVPNANSFTYELTGSPGTPSGTITVRRAHAIFSKDLLVATQYPDKTSGSASSSEAERYTLNALGERLHMTDRRGNVHDYDRDLVGRTTRDHVYSLASGTHASVRSLAWSFDTAGRLYEATSRSSEATGQVVVNQVRRLYNDFGQLVTEYQEHSGEVDTETTIDAYTSPKVDYAYAWASSTSRRTSMTYPSGKVLTYNYASGLDANVSRISSLSDSSGTLESYKFLGLSTRIERDRPEPDTRLTYVTGDTLVSGYAGDQYTGLDRFGRIVDQDWQQLNGSGTVTGHVDRFQYGYDRNGNVIYKDNKVSSSFSELYVTDRDTVAGSDGEYDKLNRLTAFQRGTLSDVNSDGKLDSSTSATRAQSWSLDALGNWSSITTDTNGDTSGGSSTANRTHNGQNQITSGSMTYDADGNTTYGGYKYDGWNRLVEYEQGGTANIISYPFDALGRRVIQDDIEYWGGLQTPDTTMDLYYSDRWQVIEDRAVSDLQVAPVTGYLRSYVWSPHYVDEMVLRESVSIAGDEGGGGGGESLTEGEGGGATTNSSTTTTGVTWTYSRGTVQYVQQDHNYNVTSLTGTTNTATARFVYDPYGTVTYLTAAWGAGSSGTSDNFNYLHQGGRWNAVLGLYHFRHREYSAVYGRWMQNDPARYIDGANLYAYERTAPTGGLDPSGLRLLVPTYPSAREDDPRKKFPDQILGLLATICPCFGLKLQSIADQDAKKGSIVREEVVITCNDEACRKDHSTGCELIERLVNSNETVAIRNGRGNGAWEYDPQTNEIGFYPGADQFKSYKVYLRPPGEDGAYAGGSDYIGSIAASEAAKAAILAHEMLHALHDIENTRSPGESIESVTIHGPKGPQAVSASTSKPVSNEELNTVGSPASGRPSASITENSIRRELGLPLRLTYYEGRWFK